MRPLFPLFTGYFGTDTRAAAWGFAQKVFWDMAVVLAVLAVLGVVFSRQIIGLFTIFSGNAAHWGLAVSLNRIIFPVDLFSGFGGRGVGDPEQLSRVCDTGGHVDFFQSKLHRVLVSIPVPSRSAFDVRKFADARRGAGNRHSCGNIRCNWRFRSQRSPSEG